MKTLCLGSWKGRPFLSSLFVQQCMNKSSSTPHIEGVFPCRGRSMMSLSVRRVVNVARWTSPEAQGVSPSEPVLMNQPKSILKKQGHSLTRPSTPPQLCVVCHRMRISEIVTRVSMGLYTLSHDQDFYIQKYRNECTDNEPETYRADKCFVPGGAGDSVYNGIIDPIVCYTTPDDYEWKCKDGEWYVDQSNLMNAALL